MVEVEEVIKYIGTFFLLLNAIFSLVVMVLLCFDFTINREYEDINLFIESEHPMTYFRVDNGNDTVTKKHNFSYWNGMNVIQNCNYDDYPCEIFVHPVDGFNLTIWRNTTFISENYTKYNYLTLLKQAKPRGKPCDEGYKQCGILDSFNQTLCLLENETCPLNQIELSNSSTPSDIFTNKNAVNTTLLNDNKTYLHTSNAEINSLVITEIVFGPESFCFDSEERKLGPPEYWCEISSTNGTCTEYVGYETYFRYISLDKYTKFNVYNENGIIIKIQDFIEYSGEPYLLEELKKYNLHLYKRNYVGFNLTCLGDQELNGESFNSITKFTDTFFELTIVTMPFLIIQFFLNLFAFSIDSIGWGIVLLLETPTFVMIPLISVSFGLFLASPSIFQCADVPMVEKLIDSEKIGIILETVSLGLYMLLLVIHLVVYSIDTRCECCTKIANYCKKRKEKRELARLGFIKEESQAELKTF